MQLKAKFQLFEVHLLIQQDIRLLCGSGGKAFRYILIYCPTMISVLAGKPVIVAVNTSPALTEFELNEIEGFCAGIAIEI